MQGHVLHPIKVPPMGRIGMGWSEPDVDTMRGDVDAGGLKRTDRTTEGTREGGRKGGREGGRRQARGTWRERG